VRVKEECWMPLPRNPDKRKPRGELVPARVSKTVACCHLERRKKKMDDNFFLISVLHCTKLIKHLCTR